MVFCSLLYYSNKMSKMDHLSTEHDQATDWKQQQTKETKKKQHTTFEYCHSLELTTARTKKTGKKIEHGNPERGVK